MSSQQRCYIPLTLEDFSAGTQPLAGPGAHVCAVAPEELGIGGEAEEVAEYEAFLLAAAIAAALSTQDGRRHRRLILSADVPRDHLEHVEGRFYRLREAVDQEAVVSGHVDEPGAPEEARAGASSDEETAEALEDADLLWYDASELPALTAQA